MENSEAQSYLFALINKNLRILSTDGRTFRGQFKCVDPDANVVIAQTYEYRHLPTAQIEGSDLLDRSNSDVMSRYLGLVVIPGEHIIKLEHMKTSSSPLRL
ncbi:hypothetical protein N3K66_005574 [Trichothecium roseum]|uniref:Uncharacterized protein n=1 Tax=Trichothecium roseum TaxID=47278 RepID=A0ACC0UYA4_9HYPO|nr:hypothetical protein N3K66_005574 [Trichothecium roseum]